MNIFEGNLGPNNKLVDVQGLITGTIVKALDKCQMQGKRVNWPQLQDYVMEFFTCADYRAKSCIEDAKKISKYI